MSLAIRVIPCLDVAAGRVVKGVQLPRPARRGRPRRARPHLRRAGRRRDHLPRRHRDGRGAGDASTTSSGATAEQVFIPLTVGGAVRCTDDVAASRRPARTRSASTRAAIARPDAGRRDRRPLRRAGASCSPSTSSDRPAHPVRLRRHDARRPHRDRASTPSPGPARPSSAARASCSSTPSTPTARSRASTSSSSTLMRAISRVPVIASGGAGALEHFAPAVAAGADAVLAASRVPQRRADRRRREAALAAAGAVVRRPGVRIERQDRARPTPHPRPSRRSSRAPASTPTACCPRSSRRTPTREVLMMGWMDAEALRRTLTEGRVTFWSRSRQEYWRKGDTSGHVQFVRGAALDCDADALLVTRRPDRRRVPHRRARVLRHATRSTPVDRERPRMSAHAAAPPPRGRVRRAAARAAASSRSSASLFADSETPLGIFRKLAMRAGGRMRPGTFLLESAEQGGIWSRYSFVGVAAFGVAHRAARPPGLAGLGPAGLPRVRRRRHHRRLPRGARRPPLALGDARASPGLPPLTGGLVGYIGWDAVRAARAPAGRAARRLRGARARHGASSPRSSRSTTCKGTVSLIVDRAERRRRRTPDAAWADAQRAARRARVAARRRRARRQLAEVDLDVVPAARSAPRRRGLPRRPS